MNRRHIETLIPLAMEAIEKSLRKQDGRIPKVYDGYIAAFGPSVITAGLLQTATFYDGDKKKKKITDLFMRLLGETQEVRANETLSGFLKRKNRSDLKRLKKKILDIAVACKLAVRTFEFDESEGD